MKLRLHPLYKNLLLLAIVLGPLYWLLLTEDGQLRADVALLSLLGKPELNLTLEGLHAGLTESQLREIAGDLSLRCLAVATPFGDRACTTEIAIFNSVPARTFTLYLQGDQARAVRVDYRPHAQGALEAQFRHRLGLAGQRDPAHPEAQTWPARDGLVLMPADRPGEEAQAALFWLSAIALRDSRSPGDRS